MKSYSQSREDEFIQNYFGDQVGTLLSIGENDGLTMSNARALLEKGWSGHLVEPSSVFYNLKRLYLGNEKVQCYNVAISLDGVQGIADFYESGAHVPNGTDRALVSTLAFNEMQRWPDVKFNTIKVNVVPFRFLWEMTDFAQFDFISIDAEGFDLDILQQIDLAAVGCKCLVIEHNGFINLKEAYKDYCRNFGLMPVLENAENIIFIK